MAACGRYAADGEMNCAAKATKNMIVFGWNVPTASVVAKAARGLAGGRDHAPPPCPARRIARTPRNTRYSAPAHFSSVKACADAASTAAAPASDAAKASALPTAMPATAASAARRPEPKAKPTMVATPGPGISASASDAATNAAQVPHAMPPLLRAVA